jgi:predicted dehydrogenase
MKNHTRREFIRRSSTAAASLASLTALGGVHANGAEKPAKISVGIIGCGGIMTTHLRRIAKLSNEVSVAWLCDVDPQKIDKSLGLLSSTTVPKTTARYEDVLADESVDACFIATPDHWHALIALAAMKAGKDIYIEKPFSHVYSEGPLIAAAAKKYGRVVQHGIQSRSSPVTEQAMKLLQEGIIGEVKVARAWNAESRPVVQAVDDSAVPEGVDYDRWLGPAPAHAFNPHRFHKSWRLYRDYSIGGIGDDGVHNLDMATMALGVKTLPTRITAHGGRMLEGHESEFPENMNVTYEFPDGKLLIYEQLPTTPYGIYNVDNGNMFYGTEGYMLFSIRGFFNVFLGPKSKPGPTESKELRGKRGYEEHLVDFLTAIRNRTPTRGSAESALRCCALSHLGNITAKTHGRLDFDAETEKFRDCDEANPLLSKNYRAPYGLPDIS